MIEIHLSGGKVFTGEVVKKRFDWLPLESKGICLVETLTTTENYREPNGKVDKTREITTSHEVFIKKDFIDYVRRVK